MAFDTTIVGGGIVGCTAGFYLSRKGLKVAIVEKDTIGCGTTSNSFAWVNATAKIFDEKYHRLNAAGHNMYCDLMVRFGEDNLGAQPMGALGVISKSDESGYAGCAGASTAIGRVRLSFCLDRAEAASDHGTAHQLRG